MAKIYQISDSNSAIGGFRALIEGGDGTTGSVTFSANSGGGTQIIPWLGPATGYSGNTPTGNWTVTVNITTGDSSCTINCTLSRAISTGSQSSGVVNSTAQTASAGIKTFTFTNPALGTWASTDLVRIDVTVTNTSSHGSARTVIIETDTTNSQVSTQLPTIVSGSFSANAVIQEFKIPFTADAVLKGTVTSNKTTYFNDTFSRSVTGGGWGISDSGHRYYSALATEYASGIASVSGGVGTLTYTAGVNGAEQRVILDDTLYSNSNDSTYVGKISQDLPVASGDPTSQAGLIVRAVQNPEPEGYIAYFQNNVVAFSLVWSAWDDTHTSLGSVSRPDILPPTSSSDAYWIKISTSGSSNPITIKAKIWKDGQSEPSAWDIDTTSSAGSASGVVGVYQRQNLSTTTGAVAHWDNLEWYSGQDLLFTADAVILKSASATLTADAVIQASSYIALDEFNRTIVDDWGTADYGGTWSPTSADFDVSSGVATILHSVANLHTPRLDGIPANSTDVEITTKFKTSVASDTGDIQFYNIARHADTSNYVRLEATLRTTGNIRLILAKTVANTTTTITTGSDVATHTADTWYWLKLSVNADNLKGKVWQDGSAEPDWQVTGTLGGDLSAGGQVGLRTRTTASNTHPITFSFDHYDVIASTAGATVSGSFTADAVIKVVNSTTFLSDAVLRGTTSSTFSANAYIITVISSSITSNAVLRKTQSVTFTADARLLNIVGGTFTANSVIRGTISSSFTTDSVLVNGVSASFTADARLLVVNSGSISANAVIKKTAAASWTADAYLVNNRQGSYTADATLLNATSVAFSADAYLVVLTTNTFSANAVLRSTQSDIFTVDAVIVSTSSVSVAANAVLKATSTATFTGAAAILASVSGSFTADAVLSANVATSFSADAYIIYVQTSSITADAVLFKTTTNSFTADGYFVSAGSAAFNADAVLLRVESVTFNADAYLVNNIAGSFNSNAVLLDTRSVNISLDAVIRVVTASTVSADAVLLGTLSAAFDASAVLLGAVSGTFIADSVFAGTVSGAITADALLQTITSGTFTADASLQAQALGTGSFRADAVFTATASSNFSANAYIINVRTSTITADSVILSAVDGSLTGDAVILSTTLGSATANAVLLATSISSVTSNAVIRKAASATFTADAYLITSGAVAFTANAVIKREVSATFSANAYLRYVQSQQFTADAQLLTIVNGIIIADAILQAAIIQSLTANAVLRRTQTGSLSANAVLVATISEAFIADAYLLGTSGGSFTADAVLFKTQTTVFLADAFLLPVVIRTHPPRMRAAQPNVSTRTGKPAVKIVPEGQGIRIRPRK